MKLKLYVNQTLTANTDYTFSFEVVNPAEGQLAQDISVWSVGLPIAEVKAGVAMRVSHTEFSVRNIGQSSPFPCDDNTITLTLVSNVPIFAPSLPFLYNKIRA